MVSYLRKLSTWCSTVPSVFASCTDFGLRAPPMTWVPDSGPGVQEVWMYLSDPVRV